MSRKVPYFIDKRYLHRVSLYSSASSLKVYPYNIPAIRNLGTLEFDENVTFFVGENGSGKSTLVEAIAIKAGFAAGGGTQKYVGAAGNASDLEGKLKLERGISGRSFDGFFLRAESFYNVASSVDATNEYDRDRLQRSFGGRSLHTVSHGESFMALVANRFNGGGLYILDEPEAALSPSRLLVLLGLIDTLARQQNSQFIIATHSPILLAYPHATIYELSASGIHKVAYEDTEHYKVTLDFLRNRDVYLNQICSDDPVE